MEAPSIALAFQGPRPDLAGRALIREHRQAAMNGVLNVRADVGAIGDGCADDTTAPPLTFPSILAGQARADTTSVPEARPGDMVTLGPPGAPAGAFPPGLIPSAVVTANGAVEVRLYNATGASVTPPAGRWTLTIGGGPGAGGAQEISNPNQRVPLIPSHPLPSS